MNHFYARALRRNDLRLNLRGRCADGVDALHPLAQQIVEHGVVTAFVFPAEDQVDVRRERFQGLDRGIHVGGLGIVVILDAPQGGDILQTMLDCLEVVHGLADCSRRAAEERARAHRSQRVLRVMSSFQRDLG